MSGLKKIRALFIFTFVFGVLFIVGAGIATHYGMISFKRWEIIRSVNADVKKAAAEVDSWKKEEALIRQIDSVFEKLRYKTEKPMKEYLTSEFDSCELRILDLNLSDIGDGKVSIRIRGILPQQKLYPLLKLLDSKTRLWYVKALEIEPRENIVSLVTTYALRVTNKTELESLKQRGEAEYPLNIRLELVSIME